MHVHLLLSTRNQTTAICQTSQLKDDQLVDKYQYVEITWISGRKGTYTVSDKYKFMYKRNPFIDDVMPKATILR